MILLIFIYLFFFGGGSGGGERGRILENQPGPGCSKLTTSLVNEPLKFQTLISQIRQYFLLKNVRSFCIAKASLIFSTKNFSVFGYKVAKA